MRRALATAAGASLALVTLSACTPLDQVWARLDSGSITFLLCEPTLANEIHVDQRRIDRTTPSEKAWEVHSETPQPFAAGDTIEFGDAPKGFDVVTAAASLDFDTYNYSLAVLNRRSEEDVVTSVTANFSSDELSADYWVTADGERSTDPCAN